MNEEDRKQTAGSDSRFNEEIGRKEERKIRARREKKRGLWFGLGMFGIVGWSVAVPALLFTALGLWIDRSTESRYSWTLMLLLIGIIAGCMNAWYWVSRESRNE